MLTYLHTTVVSFLSVNRKEKKNSIEGREALRRNARNEEHGRTNETDVLHKVCRST
jgi:hypothetical protein